MPNFNLENYSTVEERIAQFYADFPQGSIRTFMVVRDGPEVIFEARVYRNAEEAAQGIYTSGWAREIEGRSPVNKTSHTENCETSAVGRALANLGYTADATRPSRAEMLKVARQQQEHAEALEYIKAEGANVPDDLKERIRKEWKRAQQEYRVARELADAIETAKEAVPA
jgi:hypothetical protein